MQLYLESLDCFPIMLLQVTEELLHSQYLVC